MGKGFNNYMCKKFFHPGSRQNRKRVSTAQQKTEVDIIKQDQIKAQYAKEQDLHDSKLLVSKESKEKLSLSFMYEPPPGMKKEPKRDGETEFKLQWQRKYDAPLTTTHSAVNTLAQMQVPTQVIFIDIGFVYFSFANTFSRLFSCFQVFNERKEEKLLEKLTKKVKETKKRKGKKLKHL
jgi:CBF1 interacting corepressor